SSNASACGTVKPRSGASTSPQSTLRSSIISSRSTLRLQNESLILRDSVTNDVKQQIGDPNRQNRLEFGTLSPGFGIDAAKKSAAPRRRFHAFAVATIHCTSWTTFSFLSFPCARYWPMLRRSAASETV